MSVIFEHITVPKILVPKQGIEQANKLAKDFVTFVEGVTEGYNNENGTSITTDQGLQQLLDSGITFKTLVDQNPEKVAWVKKAFGSKWSGQKGYSKGYRFMNPKWAKWWTFNILLPYRPDLGKVIVEHPKGEEWMKECVLTLRELFYGR